MNKVLFLDRDGTINVDYGYVYQRENFELLPGVLEGLRLFQNMGYKLIIVTNQSGIARGYFSEEEYLELSEWLIGWFRDNGIFIEKIYYCPHLAEASVIKYRQVCQCRKPNLGMFYQAIDDYDIDVDNSIVIGDKVRDVELCKRCGTKGFVLYQQEEKTIESVRYIHGGIIDAAKIVEKEECK